MRTCIFVSLSLSMCTCKVVSLSVSAYVHAHICESVSMCTCIFVSLSVCAYVHVHIWLSVCLCVHVHICESVSVCTYVFVSLSVSLSVHVHICESVCLFSLFLFIFFNQKDFFFLFPFSVIPFYISNPQQRRLYWFESPFSVLVYCEVESCSPLILLIKAEFVQLMTGMYGMCLWFDVSGTLERHAHFMILNLVSLRM